MTEEERQLMEQMKKQLELSNKIAYSQYQLMQKLEEENREIKEAIKELDHGFATWYTTRFWIKVILFIIAAIIIARLYPYIQVKLAEMEMQYQILNEISKAFKGFY